MSYKWSRLSDIQYQSYTCGYCGSKVAPSYGFLGNELVNSVPVSVCICPRCNKPTFIDEAGKQTPGARYGSEVKGITNSGIASLYDEARDSTALSAYTAAVLVCRKILMNIAVQHGAEEGESFVHYVKFLSDKGFVPPNGKEWVDRIRTKGNEATHEIKIMTKEDAELILHFTEMLLRFTYEFPSLLVGDK